MLIRNVETADDDGWMHWCHRHQAAAGSAASTEAVERMLAPAAEKRVTLTQEELDEILGVVGADALEGVPLQSSL